MFTSWENLPADLRKEAVKPYCEILRTKKASLVVKRVCDIVFSLLLMIISAPLSIVIALLTVLFSGFPIFFRQDRITRYGKPFKILKFRTMKRDHDGAVLTVKDDQRVTALGKFLRSTRFDELPQLINVLKGDMSFVGTRPELPSFVERYSEEMKATLLMRAGITSRASVAFIREDELLANIPADKVADFYTESILPAKMRYNLEYIRRFSAVEDIKIIGLTVKSFLERLFGKESEQ